MSYSIEFYVKLNEINKFVCIGSPDFSSPTYNIGQILRKAMEWDFKGDEYYPCKDVVKYILKGLNNLYEREYKYKKYEKKGCSGTTYTFDFLTSLAKSIHTFSQDNNLEIEYIYMRWN